MCIETGEESEPAEARLMDLEKALQVAAMLRPTDERAQTLQSALRAAAAPAETRKDLEAVDEERAKAVWTKLDGENGVR